MSSSAAAVETPNFSIYSGDVSLTPSKYAGHIDDLHITDPFERQQSPLFPTGLRRPDSSEARADDTLLPSVRFELGAITGHCSLNEWDSDFLCTQRDRNGVDFERSSIFAEDDAPVNGLFRSDSFGLNFFKGS